MSARRREVVLACLALLIALAVPSARLQLTPGSLSSVPQSTESARGLQLLRNRVGPGAITPIQVVVDGNTPGAARSSSAAAGTLRLATRLVDDPQVFVAAIGPRAPYVDSSGQVRRLIAYPRREFGDPRTRGLVTRLRSSFIPGARFPSGFLVWTGGAPAQGVDFLDRVWGTFPLVVLLVLLLAYLTLLLAFRSLLLPLLAVMLDVLSVAATYGMLVLLFQDGLGSTLLGLYRSPQIEAWVPVFLFATLFGLSMDYQVFLVRRMREAWDAGSHNQDAIELGLERTGQVVSAAALIMVVSFAGFIAGQVAGLQELGVGLALGVLLDATVVRLLLMPALMLLLGRWNWWQPAGPGGL